ncbi:S-layer homology domain-containing protein [Planococcus beigongshangi]|uniref:S-layer homology domain-containing protein n=1 Tax=Planococcus beigongshangi TaxID=2782536 RepID=UPI00193BCA3B|nr:S-layer homology domain-containing protein [Planococcus beigongshangi]
MKKVVGILFTVLLLLSIVSPASAATFKDVSSYKAEIGYLVDKKIITGYPDGTFKPTADLKRLNAVQMILREKGITDFTAPNPGLTDMKPGTHGYKEVAKAVQLGFISGKTAANGTKYFDPNGTLTRAQMAKILAEGYGLKKTKDYTFFDVSDSHGAKDYISTLATENITTGFLDGTFRPNDKLQRQHFAAFMARLLDEKFRTKSNPQMEVHFIDVGQGDSILIQSPEGKNMLVDAGTKGSGAKVVSFLKSKGVTTLDVVVATHPDADHIGGLVPVLQNFKVNQFIDSGKAHTTDTYLELLQLIDTKNIPFKVAATGDKITLGSLLSTTVLHADSSASDNNDASIVLHAVYGSVSFLLTGDADAGIEQKLVNNYNVKSTYLKAGHHGSNTSSSKAFLNEVKPAGTILSYGKDNSYGHPHSEVVANLKAVNSNIYSTVNSGDITVVTNGATHAVSAKPWAAPVTPKPDPTPTPKPPAPKPPAPAPKPDFGSGLYVIPGAPTSFQNCTALKAYYPLGVKKGHPAYASKHDRDKDNWACES